MSYIKYQITSVGYQVSDKKYQISINGYQVPDIKYQISSISCQALGCKYHIANIRMQEESRESKLLLFETFWILNQLINQSHEL